MVCLSGAAYEQVRDRVKETFVDLGEKALKNISRPMRAYQHSPGSPRPVLAAAVRDALGFTSSETFARRVAVQEHERRP